MLQKYNSEFYNSPIEVENVDGETFVNIITNDNKKIIYSWYNFEDKTSYSPYIKNSILGSFIGKIPKDVLILGFGAGGFARYFKDYLGSKIKLTGVEIDKTMIKIAKDEFSLTNVDYFNMDYIEALDILNKKKNKKFDLIFIDLYDENSKIPQSLLNKVVIEYIKNLLLKDAKLIINFANFDKNTKFYDEINSCFLEALNNKYYVEILNGKDDSGNIVGIYNLRKNYTSEDIILNYLEKVQNEKINYDPNLIDNIFLK